MDRENEGKTKLEENLSQEEIEKNQIQKSISSIMRFNENISYYEYIFSICLVGDSDVGKTSLLTRYSDGIFNKMLTNTIGVDFKIINLKYKENCIKLHLWDTAGQERFRSITVNYFRNVHSFIFVYDINNKESFKKIENWVEIATCYNKHAVINFLIANKCDLSREVSIEESLEYAKRKNLVFFETSAKNDDNVSEAFNFMAYKLIEFYSKNRTAYEGFSQSNINNTKNTVSSGKKIDDKKNSKCC